MHRVLTDANRKEFQLTVNGTESQYACVPCLCAYTVPEYAVRCGEIKATAICVFNIANIHVNGCDAHS